MIKIKNLVQFSVLFLLFILGIFLFLFQNQTQIKNHILSQVKENAGIEINYEAESVELFPFVGVNLSNVKLNNSNSQKSFEAEFEFVNLSVTWKSLLLKNIQIEKLILSRGDISVYSDKFSTDKDNNTLDFLRKFKSLHVQTIDIKDINIYIFIKNNELKEELSIKDFQYINNTDSHEIKVFGNHRGGKISLDFTFKLDLVNTLTDLEWKGRLKLENYSPISFRKYYSLFQTQSFDSSLINGEFLLIKIKSSNIISCSNSFSIYNLNFKGLPPSGLLQINSQLAFNMDSYYLSFQSAEVRLGKDLIGATKGYLDIGKKKVKLFLEVNASNVRLEIALPFILGFVNVKMDEKGETPDFDGILRIQSNHTSFHDYYFKDSKVDLNIINSKINLNIIESEFYEGKISGNGKIEVNSKIHYDFNIHCDNINSYNLIQKYSNVDYITGKLHGEFQLLSEGEDASTFFNELKIQGNFKVTDGKLLGYANLFKPILAIGKYLNWKGPKGESTEFQSLGGNFQVAKRNVELKGIQLIGVGIDAKGSGKISFDRKIDLKFIVGLGGIAGKAVSIPILYKGIMPNNSAYIDPIWLGSVYFGTTILGGPVGGVAGSAVSEYIGVGIEKVKQFFSIFKSKE